jgi:hypothetical protein
MFAFSLNLMPQPQAESKCNCQHISGHIAGQVIGTSPPLCDGALTETGTFTDSEGNTLGSFVACVTSLQQEGEGAFKLRLVHTYTTNSGTFTTSDSIVLSPINPPIYRVDNRANITGGTGVFQDAFGFILDAGTFNFQTGVLSVDFHGQICTSQ